MSDSSVFAHVILRNSAPEPAATLALEYLLSRESALAKFAELWPEEIRRSVKARRVKSETPHGDDDARPDLSIYDETDTCRVFVENKFWAGLTDRQPVKYLEELPADGHGALLLFITPKDRVSTVWRELTERCRTNGWSITNEHQTPGPTGTLPHGRILAVTSWRSVLQQLATVAEIEPDVAQLRAHTDKMNDSAFLPLRLEELTDMNVPSRMINYGDLVEQIVQELKNRGVASTEGLRPSHGFHQTGRYLLLRDQIGVWLGVDLVLWRREQTTPLWWLSNQGEWGGVDPIWTQFEHLFGDAVVVDEEWRRCFPIHLKVGVERDTVIRAAADQISQIADRLVEALN